jgi:hypothetical protein
MTSKLHFHSIAALLSAAMLACTISHQAAGQTTVPQQLPPSSGRPQPKPVSLPHLYWHFLVHQNHLDSLAARMESQGTDGSAIRNDLQVRLQFSDAEFVPIRASSQRLAAELDGLDKQAAVIQASGTSSSNRVQLAALAAQRETYINAEISYLAASLTPKDKTILESFMVQFFAPKTISASAPLSTGQSTNGTVQP